MMLMVFVGTSEAIKASSANMSVDGGPASSEPRERRFNTEDVSKQLLRTLQPLRVDSLSLHDAAGDLLWLNEGAFGPDEHGAVMDALDVFALDAARGELQLKLDADRTALFACARDANKEVRGVALTIVETPASEEFAAKLAAPRLTALMRRFAQLLAPQVPGADAVEAARLGAAQEPAPRVDRRTRSSTRNKALPEPGKIHAHRYARLRSGGAALRYEVRLAPNASFAGDLTLATHVIEHLQRSGDRYIQTPSSFAVCLSVESVTKPGWIAKLQPVLAKAELPKDLMGFCLPPLAWDDEPQATEQFIHDCEQAGCFVCLDDFTLGSTGLHLLRSPAIKCLKLQPALIGAVVRDKFAHATLATIVQAARVLGLYCIAKQVSSQSEAKWLAAAGIEFADGVSRGVAVAATRTGEVLTLRAGD
jgi:EAL domain-containing protein (putative c-di-GMP-specific phosphodiesterase class I)